MLIVIKFYILFKKPIKRGSFLYYNNQKQKETWENKRKLSKNQWKKQVDNENGRERQE